MVKSSQWVLAGILLATVAGIEGQESGGFRDLAELSSWICPLVIEAPYEALPAGSVLEIGPDIVNLVAFTARGIPLDDLVVLHRNNATGTWERPGQCVIPPFGPEAGNRSGRVQFRLCKELPSLQISLDYVVAIAPEENRNKWVRCGAPLACVCRTRLKEVCPDTLMGWETTPSGTDARCSLAPVLAPEASGLRIHYEGLAFTSSARVVSPALPVPGGKQLSVRIVYRIPEFPDLTLENLPGPDLVKAPGETEAYLPRVGWSVSWHDAHGGAVKGPGVWRMNLTRLLQPEEFELAFEAPAEAASMRIGFAFGGKAGISLEILDVAVYEVTEHGAAATYIVRAAGKSAFPQIEMPRKTPPFELGLSERVHVSRSLGETTPEILLDGFRGLDIGKVDAGATCRIHVGLLDDGGETSDALRRNSALAERMQTLPDEGYVLDIGPERAVVLGKGPAGAFYGVQELGERLRLGGGATPSTFVMDWPTLRLRMVHQLLTWQETLKEPRAYYMRWIPELARLRINAFAFDGRGHWHRLADPTERAYWEWLFSYCREWHVTPVPMGFNYRNQMPTPESWEWLAARWVEDERYVLSGDVSLPLEPKRDAFFPRPADPASKIQADGEGRYPTIPLLGADNPVLATSEDRKMTYEHGKDFVIEGEYGVSGDQLPTRGGLRLIRPYTVRRTKGSRIPENGTILLSYNYFYRQRGWHNEQYSTCVSAEPARSFNEEGLKNTIEILRPEYIHLNGDEVVGIGRDGRDLLRMRRDGLTPGQVFADLLNGFRDSVRGYGSEAKLIVWHDVFWAAHGGWALSYQGPYYAFDGVDYLSKDLLMCVWNYGGTPDRLQLVARHFLDRGFAVIGAPAETGANGVPAWCHGLHALQTDFGEQVHGVFLTSWRGPEQVNFRWRHDLGRWGWNPAPWIHLDGRDLWVVDLFCEPIKVHVNGTAISLENATPESGLWQAWTGGFVKKGRLPDSIGDRATIEVFDITGITCRTVPIPQ